MNLLLGWKGTEQRPTRGVWEVNQCSSRVDLLASMSRRAHHCGGHAVHSLYVRCVRCAARARCTRVALHFNCACRRVGSPGVCRVAPCDMRLSSLPASQPASALPHLMPPAPPSWDWISCLGPELPGGPSSSPAPATRSIFTDAEVWGEGVVSSPSSWDLRASQSCWRSCCHPFCPPVGAASQPPSLALACTGISKAQCGWPRLSGTGPSPGAGPAAFAPSSHLLCPLRRKLLPSLG